MNYSVYLGPYSETIVVVFKVLGPFKYTMGLQKIEDLTLEQLTDDATTIFKLIPGNTATISIRGVADGRFEFSAVKHPFIGVPTKDGLDRSDRDGAPNGFDPFDPPQLICADLKCATFPINCPPGTDPVCVNGKLECV